MRNTLMTRGAYKIVTQCAGVKAKESAVVVCDHLSYAVANEVARACIAVGAETDLVVMQPRSGHGEEPPMTVAAAMEKADVVFNVTTFSISHTLATRKARAAGARIITMPEFTPEMLISGAIEADFIGQKPLVEQVAGWLTAGKTAHLWSEQGTDFRLSLDGRDGRALTGIAHEASGFTCPPNIEASIAPIEDTAYGTLVVNASIAGLGLLSCPIRIQVEAGRAVSIESMGQGPEAKQLIDELKRCEDENVYRIAELGIGLNPQARLTGSLLEDEAVFGSMHVALGSNASFGGAIKAPRHIDMVMTNSCLTIDGKTVIKDGKLIY